MEKKKIESFKKRLEERQQDLRRVVSRNVQDGRDADLESAQDIADKRPTPTPRNSSSASRTTSASYSGWWRRRWDASAKAASASAPTAVTRSTPSDSRPCRGRATASSARRRWKRASSNRRSNSCGIQEGCQVAAFPFHKRPNTHHRDTEDTEAHRGP